MHSDRLEAKGPGNFGPFTLSTLNVRGLPAGPCLRGDPGDAMAREYVGLFGVDLEALEDALGAVSQLALVKEWRFVTSVAAAQVHCVILLDILQRVVAIAVQFQTERLELFHEEGLVAVEQPRACKLAAVPRRTRLFDRA